jgi:hypothetical protein
LISMTDVEINQEMEIEKKCSKEEKSAVKSF